MLIEGCPAAAASPSGALRTGTVSNSPKSRILDHPLKPSAVEPPVNPGRSKRTKPSNGVSISPASGCSGGGVEASGGFPGGPAGPGEPGGPASPGAPLQAYVV